MQQPDQTPDGLLEGLFAYQLARPVLYALAQGPGRYRDLVAALASTAPVYSKTLDNALRYLLDNGLIIRTNHQPRLTRYAITSLGCTVSDALEAMKQAVAEHQGYSARHAAERNDQEAYNN